MLLSLHVKNLALIEETEVEFAPGLNILTGETGAGKSILIGSVSLALGAKADSDLIRHGADSALVELTFDCQDERLGQKLLQMELPREDVITVSRRLQQGRSVSRVNGETVSARQLKEISELLLDIHGQHEHQSLLHKKKHLEILDAFAGAEAETLMREVRTLYKERERLRDELEAGQMDEAARKRELSLLRYEAEEIGQAALRDGEDEELENRYRIMANSQKIGEALGAAHRFTGNDGEGAAELIGRAVRELTGISGYDETLAGLSEQIGEIESLLGDFNREIADYLSDMEFDGGDFAVVQDRLNQINRLKEKYGKSIEDVLAYAGQISEKIEKLDDYETYRKQMLAELSKAEEALLEKCEALSALRREKAAELTGLLRTALEDLNFLSVEFVIGIERKEPSADGFDDVEFLISTNPGEAVKPLGAVASGGELSRIMLAIKTVLAERDAVDTLIFDEIDTGISGRTAWKVAEKLGMLARAHQVICITHLPQIAAMADAHFLIEKQTDGESTITGIHRLSDARISDELARMLGADTLTQAALDNAKELRMQAAKIKQK